MNPRKILVTGGFGYVGARLTPHLLQLGHDVCVLDLLLYTEAGLDALRREPAFPSWQDRFKFIQGDLRDPEGVEKALTGRDTVIHLAAISNDPTGEIDEVLTRQVNFDALGMLLALSRKAGVERFINASSSSVFGIKDVPNVTEQLEPEPLTFYSKYKMLGEWLVASAASPGFCAVNIRPATICGYSPRQRFDLTVNKLTADAVRKRVITVHGGEQRRPNVGITDMIHLYGELTQSDPTLINGRTFNFGFENHKVIEIARIIQSELQDLQVEIKITETLDRRDYHISSSKIQTELSYRPISSIRQEVAHLRRALDQGLFPDIEAPQHYNMKFMKLDRHAGAYRFLSR
ncbi:MAG TPA: NAD-dependent epimerase/dehydratase [Candidatus Paceibacterota bacterium]|nr:NAD-dependent epimerase/dehydratase [Verrucomicrobiota bacterium]HRY51038.1 NAD-dependent epimerase/dehydratase [Candidatus Paceibacterota bacterium]HSA02024.1 NAD-dependent epimerase/dehydratase [Candidatus Paceibacterota bacterium]